MLSSALLALSFSLLPTALGTPFKRALDPNTPPFEIHNDCPEVITVYRNGEFYGLMPPGSRVGASPVVPFGSSRTDWVNTVWHSDANGGSVDGENSARAVFEDGAYLLVHPENSLNTALSVSFSETCSPASCLDAQCADGQTFMPSPTQVNNYHYCEPIKDVQIKVKFCKDGAYPGGFIPPPPPPDVTPFRLVNSCPGFIQVYRNAEEWAFMPPGSSVGASPVVPFGTTKTDWVNTIWHSSANGGSVDGENSARAVFEDGAYLLVHPTNSLNTGIGITFAEKEIVPPPACVPASCLDSQCPAGQTFMPSLTQVNNYHNCDVIKDVQVVVEFCPGGVFPA